MDSLLAEGDSVYRRDAERAAAFWERARSLAATAHDSVRLAYAWTGLGQAAMQRGDYALAESLGVRALQLKDRLGLRAQRFRSLNMLGLLAYYRDRNAEASRYLREAANAAHETGDRGGAAKAALNLGLVHREYGRFAQADSVFAAAAQDFVAVGDSVSLGRAANNRAALAIDVGDWTRAFEQLAVARQIYTQTSDSAGVLNALGQAALAHAAMGEPARAFAAVDSAIALARQVGKRSEVVDDLRILADLFRDAGDYANALETYRQAERVLDSASTPDLYARLRRGHAQTLMALNQSDDAARLLRESLAVHETQQLRHAAFDDRLLLAAVAQQRNRGGEADRWLREAARQLDTLDSPLARARWLLQRGQWLAAERQWRAVDSLLRDVAVVSPRLEIERLALLARSGDAQARPDSALALGERALQQVARVRSRHQSDALSAHFSDRYAALFAEHTIRLLRAGRPAEAFVLAEQARSRRLRTLLGNRRADARARSLSDREAESLLLQLDVLLARLQDQERQPPIERGADYASAQTELRDSIAATRSRFEMLDAKRRAVAQSPRGSPDPAGDDGAADLHDLHAVLRPGEVVLSYLVGDQRVIGFALSRDSLWARELPTDGERLGYRVRLVRDLLAGRERAGMALPALGTLYDALIRPMLGASVHTYGRLLVVPHGPLQHLPFAALRDTSRQQFLVESHTLTVVPALALLRAHRSLGPAAMRGRDITLLAPYPDELPATRREVQASGRILGSTRVHTGASANEPQLRRALSRAGGIHVATHAQSDVQSPLFSSVLLGARSAVTTRDDGRLEVRELLALELQSPFVFLSGCETATAVRAHLPSTQLDAWTTMAQAWLRAGTRTVVATMWRIDDVAAADMATAFYRAQSAAGSDVALANAQRAMLRTPATSSPYFWASHQLIGDSRTWVDVPRANVQ